ncbi:hypothetical protein PR048_019338 [Dryococelus australis]|uniref:Alpha-1,3-glucosyltransferase n=1 Tax=Dryococelus australis TaxID=614101 RepID=A0ABQ9H3B0_9NEOP|nr:hypothetical protein PR048_019338 [Dryococelus australis]
MEWCWNEGAGKREIPEIIRRPTVSSGTIPTLLAVLWKNEARMYLFLSTVGHYSLFPLLFTRFETFIKLFLLISHSSYAFFSLTSLFQGKGGPLNSLLSIVELAYLVGLLPLYVYDIAIHPLSGLGTKLPFLSLMLTSVYCALGVLYFWLLYYWYFLTHVERKDKVQIKKKIIGLMMRPGYLLQQVLIRLGMGS